MFVGFFASLRVTKYGLNLAFTLAFWYNGFTLRTNGKNMTVSEITQNIIGKHDFEIVPERYFVGIKKGTKIRINEDSTNELFAELYDRVCQAYGTPSFVHSYYGFIWERDGKYLALATIEENYQYEVIDLFIFNRLPRGKKLRYQDYADIVQAVKQVCQNNNLTFNSYLHYHDKTFYFMPENDETFCLIMIKPHSLFFALSQKEHMEDGATKVIPGYTRRKILMGNGVSTIKKAVEDCFVAEKTAVK